MNIDLNLLERWLTGWSLARGLPRPTHEGGGLMVDVGWPAQLRRHVFVDAGPDLQQCAARIDAPFVYLKAAVATEEMRRALPARWKIESPRYLMYRATAMNGLTDHPAGYVADMRVEHGAHVVRFADASAQTAAVGRVVLNAGSAVFDRIETAEPHRGRGLASAIMGELDALARQAGTTERLLVATETGRALYERLGWEVLAPYSTAVLDTPPP